MRLTAALALVAIVGTLMGCQIVPYTDNRFSLAYEAEITPHQVRFPTMLTYPDTTDFFYPLYDNPPRSDLNLRGIDCQVRSDGTLTVLSRVQNMGSDIIAAVPMVSTGDFGAFRVVTIVSTASGAKERVEAVQVLPLTVPATVILASNSGRRCRPAISRRSTLSPTRTGMCPIPSATTTGLAGAARSIRRTRGALSTASQLGRVRQA